jgi:hypothetical protein
VIETDDFLRKKMPFDYPQNNNIIFEEYFYEFYKNIEIKTQRTYLPIFWTGIYCSRNFGQGDISDVQEFIESLDKTKKYFTLVQYDDGILNDVSGLDILVFSLAQDKIYDYILPTTCKPRPNINKDRNRDIFCSSFGKYKGLVNHPLQDKLINTLPKNKYLIGKEININSYYDILERSIFFICVNGRSPTTFKICECFQTGTIPVFLYDKKWIPFEDEIEFERGCVMVRETEMYRIDEILSNISPLEIKDMIEYGEYIYDNYYEYDMLSEKIINILNV